MERSGLSQRLANQLASADDIDMPKMPPSLKGSSRRMAARLLDETEIDAVEADLRSSDEEDDDENEEEEDES
jgi:hypothetical protein